MADSRRPPKIVVIGAGSAIFGTGALATLLRSPVLRGSTLALCDLDHARLETMHQLAERMNDEWDAGFTLSAGTNRRELLPGADFVIVSIQVGPREVVWRQDWEIPLRHGVRQPYAENSGPGGFAHTCRTVPEMLAIAADMEDLCPQAWMLNFTNPLSRLGLAVQSRSQVPIVGLCHQYLWGYALVAAVLAEEYGISVPGGDGFHAHTDAPNVPAIYQMIDAGQQHFEIASAGINHFAWMLDLRDRHTGEDLYPLFRERYLRRMRRSFEPFTREMFEIAGLCPTAGDTHMVEYLPWTHDPLTRPWEKYDIKLQSWEGNITRRRNVLRRAEALAAGGEPLAPLREARSEGAAEIIEAWLQNSSAWQPALNITNAGLLPGLPAWAVVEVPAVISRAGVYGVRVPALPPLVTEICRREAELAAITVEAAVTGDRGIALQALMLDPTATDIDRCRAILDDFLLTFREWLPQFWS